MQASISTNVLNAVLQFAAKKDVRYYLQAVLIETGPNGTFAVATNGHALAVARLDTGAKPMQQVMIKRETLEALAKGNKYAVLIECADRISDAGQQTARTVTLTANGGVFSVQEVEGRFPDWVRVIRTAPAREVAYFDPLYVAMVEKAGQLYRKRKGAYYLTQNGNNIGYCAIGDDLMVYVMPMREQALNLPEICTWATTL